MRVIPVSDLKNRVILREIRDHLLADGLIIYPTDTLYGIGCNFYSLEAQKKIDIFKGRKDLPYSVAVADTDCLKNLTSGSLDSLAPFKTSGSFSGLTFLFKINTNIERKYVKGSSLIGIRIFEEGALKELLEFTGLPIITTSVNISGESPANSPSLIKAVADKSGFSNEIYFVDNGTLPESKGSTIIDLSGDSMKIVREGDNLSKIEKIIDRKNRI